MVSRQTERDVSVQARDTVLKKRKKPHSSVPGD